MTHEESRGAAALRGGHGPGGSKIRVRGEIRFAKGDFLTEGDFVGTEGELFLTVQGGNFVQGRNFRQGQHGNVGPEEVHDARPGEADRDVSEDRGTGHARGHGTEEGGNQSANANRDHRRNVPDAEKAEDHAAADLQGEQTGFLETPAAHRELGAARIAADAAANLVGGGANTLHDRLDASAILDLRRGVLAGAAAGLVGGGLLLAAESKSHGFFPLGGLGVQENGFPCHRSELIQPSAKTEVRCTLVDDSPIVYEQVFAEYPDPFRVFA